MIVKINGRVASCVERKSKKGKSYYSVKFVQGEGTKDVNMFYMFSSYELEVGVQEVECRVFPRDNRLSVAVCDE